MSLAAARTALADGLAAALSVPAYRWPSEAVAAPCVVVYPGPGRYLERGDAFCQHQARFTFLFVLSAGWNEAGFDLLDEWGETVKQVTESITYDGTPFRWVSTRSATLVDIGGVEYLAAETEVTIDLD